MELIKELSGWKLYKHDILNNYTVETPEGIKQFYNFYHESSFESSVTRGWIWIYKEYFKGSIENGVILIEKCNKQIQSDKLDLFLKSHSITKEEVIDKLTPILVKAKNKFEKCKEALLRLQNELEFDVDYTMLGDTHGIYEDYQHISFSIDGIYCKFEISD